MFRWFRRMVMLGAVAWLAGCGGGEADQPDIVALAQQRPELSTLAEAVVAADLASALSGPGQYTVFAPTNAAFEQLLADLGTTKQALLADKPQLREILRYHVLAGRVLRRELPIGTPITTLQGQTFTVDAQFGIADQCGCSARIVTADIVAGNGVVHLVDTVMRPSL